MFETGYITLGRAFRAPVRMHWSTPLGLFATGFFDWNIALGTGVIILLHELGHALVATRVGARVTRIDVLPFGGRCLWVGNPRPMQRAMIAWGGVLAQLVVFLVTVGLLKQLGMPKAGLWDGLATSFTLINGLLIFMNLLPVAPLDGAEAWPLIGLAWRRSRRTRVTIQNAVKDRAMDDSEIPEEMKIAMREALEQMRAESQRSLD